jgi:hypothetical protein
MQIKEMTVWDVFKRGLKKVIIECASVKFWAAIFVGYANWHIIKSKDEFDLFGMGAFLVLLGIREAADLLQRKQGGGETK